MIGCEEGVFPHSRSVDEGNLEEERRLCYVGITRAERRLYMTYASTRSLFGARSYNMPSRFLDELPTELTDTEEAAAAATSGEPGRRGVERAAAFHVGDDVDPRDLRRGRRDRRPEGGHRDRELRRRGAGAPADGRLRPAAPPVSLAPAGQSDLRLTVPDMSAEIIDGKAIAADVRAQESREVEADRSASARRPASRPCSWATTRPRRSTSAASTARRRRRDPLGRARASGRYGRGGAARARRGAERRRRDQRRHRAAAPAGAPSIRPAWSLGSIRARTSMGSRPSTPACSCRAARRSCRRPRRA